MADPRVASATDEDSVTSPPDQKLPIAKTVPTYIVVGNFGQVFPGIYRGEYPNKKNFQFLKSLKLKAVLTFIKEDYSQTLLDFYKENGTNLIQVPITGNKEPFVHTREEDVIQAVTEIMDRRNYPIFIHCNKGKHRTGCVMGVLRKMAGWVHCSIDEEYRRYSSPKSRLQDLHFIDSFDISRVPLRKEHLPKWFTNLTHSSDLRRHRNQGVFSGEFYPIYRLSTFASQQSQEGSDVNFRKLKVTNHSAMSPSLSPNVGISSLVKNCSFGISHVEDHESKGSRNSNGRPVEENDIPDGDSIHVEDDRPPLEQDDG